MSYYAMKYAWRCPNAVVKGSVRLVLLAIAWRVPTGHLSSIVTSLGDLVGLTGLDERQVRRCRDLLVDEGELVRHGNGKLAQYEMARMVGPLFAVGPEKTGQDVRKIAGRNPDKMSGFHPDKMSEKIRTSCPSSRRTAACTDVVRTKELKATTDQEQELHAPLHDVMVFLRWFEDTYQAYNRTPSPPAISDADVELVARLLARRPPGRLQLMAHILWSVDDREDTWIPKTDRGLRVLAHKEDWLDRRVTDTPDWWRMCAHLPKCRHAGECDDQVRAVGIR